MEQFNKALSFILGLVVVVVFIIFASGKINLKGISLPKAGTATNITPTPIPNITPKPTAKPWFSFFGQPAATPTPKPTAKPSPTPVTTGSTGYSNGSNQQDPNYHPYTNSGATPVSIPNTGIPIVLFPLFGSTLLTGIFMKKTGKKE